MTIRIDPELWERFGAAAEAAGTDRATLIRRWIERYVREHELRHTDV